MVSTSPGTPRSDRYDAVVVGSGIGGLTVAALLAKAAQRVLVVERSEGPGGYAQVFRRGPYVFDPAIHWNGRVERTASARSCCERLSVSSPAYRST